MGARVGFDIRVAFRERGGRRVAEHDVPRVRRRHVARSDARDRGGDAADADAWIGRRGANPRRGSPRTRSPPSANARSAPLRGRTPVDACACASLADRPPHPSPPRPSARTRASSRACARGVSPLTPSSPPLPTTRRLDDPPLERQLGSLRRDGVVVQLRFVAVPAPVHPHAPTPSGPLTDVENDTEVSPRPVLPSNAIAYRILDAAFTADHLSTRGRAIFAAVGDVAAVAARDALIVPPPRRAGRSPETWGTSPLEPNAPGYDPKQPGKLAYDSRGENDARSCSATFDSTRARKDPCASLRIRANARRRDAAAAETLRARPSNSVGESFAARARGRGRDGDGIRIRDRHPRARGRRVALRVPGIQGARPRPRHPRAASPLSGRRARRPLSDDDDSVEDAATELEGLGAEDLVRRVDAAESSRRMAMKAADALEGEIRERFSWETRESGVETRDVLEIRREARRHGKAARSTGDQG